MLHLQCKAVLKEEWKSPVLSWTCSLRDHLFFSAQVSSVFLTDETRNLSRKNRMLSQATPGMISMKKPGFSSYKCESKTVRCQVPPGTVRAQPCSAVILKVFLSRKDCYATLFKQKKKRHCEGHLEIRSYLSILLYSCFERLHTIRQLCIQFSDASVSIH